jgi:hypothetical protein
MNRAANAGALLAAGVDRQGFLRRAALLGQPSVQPGQGRGQVGALAAVGPQLVQDGGGLVELARADQALGQLRPPQDRGEPAAAVQDRPVLPGT